MPYLSQCWLVLFLLFQDNLIGNLEIIQKTTWAKTLSKSHISPQPIKRPQLFKNSNESRCRCCGGIYRRKLSYLVTFSVFVLYSMWSLNLVRVIAEKNCINNQIINVASSLVISITKEKNMEFPLLCAVSTFVPLCQDYLSSSCVHLHFTVCFWQWLFHWDCHPFFVAL